MELLIGIGISFLILYIIIMYWPYVVAILGIVLLCMIAYFCHKQMKKAAEEKAEEKAEQERIAAAKKEEEDERSIYLPRAFSQARKELKNNPWWGALPKGKSLVLDTNIWMMPALDLWFKELPDMLKGAKSCILLPGFILDEVQNNMKSKATETRDRARIARNRIEYLQGQNLIHPVGITESDKKSYADPLIIKLLIKHSEIILYTFDKMLSIRTRARFNELKLPTPIIYTQKEFVSYEWATDSPKSYVSYNPSPEVLNILKSIPYTFRTDGEGSKLLGSAFYLYGSEGIYSKSNDSS